MIDDSMLLACNETELLWMARQQGIGFLKRGLAKDLLVAIITGREEPKPEHFSQSSYTRKKLEQYLQTNIARYRNQLPGCDGFCTTFPCSEGRHGMCFAPNNGVVQ